MTPQEEFERLETLIVSGDSDDFEQLGEVGTRYVLWEFEHARTTFFAMHRVTRMMNLVAYRKQLECRELVRSPILKAVQRLAVVTPYKGF